MGWNFAGRDRGLRFIRPYRNIGELNPTEQLKLARHPFEVAQAVIDTYSKQGPGVHQRRARARWSGSSGWACTPSARAATPS